MCSSWSRRAFRAHQDPCATLEVMEACHRLCCCSAPAAVQRSGWSWDLVEEAGESTYSILLSFPAWTSSYVRVSTDWEHDWMRACYCFSANFILTTQRERTPSDHTDALQVSFCAYVLAYFSMTMDLFTCLCLRLELEWTSKLRTQEYHHLNSEPLSESRFKMQ